jgi:hypothetical protein
MGERISGANAPFHARKDLQEVFPQGLISEIPNAVIPDKEIVHGVDGE